MISITSFLLLALISVFFATGLYVCFLNGMIFSEISDLAKKYLPNVILKPLFTCLFCMGGFYSQFIWFGYALTTKHDGFGVILQGSLFCIVVCGLMSIPYFLLMSGFYYDILTETKQNEPNSESENTIQQ